MANGVTANSMRVSVKAPDLGAFPLDHYRECKSQIEQYYTCLKSNDYITPMCRDEVKQYLQCRMDRGLMKPADLDGFGIPPTDFVPTRQHRIDLKQQWLRQKMNQVTVVWEENYKRDDLHIPDGFEREKGSSGGGGGGGKINNSNININSNNTDTDTGGGENLKHGDSKGGT